MAALAADPNVHARRGGLYAAWTLAREYGFTDIDGRRSDEMDLFSVRSMLHQMELDPSAKEEVQRLRAYLDRYG